MAVKIYWITFHMSGRSQESANSSIFPLPLAPIEHYFLAQECPGYPMDFWLFLGVSGTLQRANFEQALRIVLKRHPLLQSVVQGEVWQRTKSIKWVWTPDQLPFIDWAEEGRPSHSRWEIPIDLHHECGLRFLLRESKHQTHIWIQVHHACCDGRGMRKFLVDLFLAYHLLVSGELQLSPFNVEEPRDLLERGTFTKMPLNWGKISYCTKRIIRHFCHSFEPIHKGDRAERASPSDLAIPPHYYHLFSRKQSKKIQDIVDRDAISMNSFLVSQLFRTLDRWNEKMKSQPRRYSLRIALGVDLRDRVTVSSSAMNTLGAMFIDRDHHTITEDQHFAQNIHRQIIADRDADIPLISLRILKWFGLMRKGVLLLARQRRRHFSCSLTYYGSVVRDIGGLEVRGEAGIGNLALETTYGFQTYRPEMGPVFSAALYGGRLSVCMRYHRDEMSPAKAKALFETYVASLVPASQ